MKVRRTFRQWADQWPQESRWILWAWAVCLLAVLCFAANALWKWNRTRSAHESASARRVPVAPAAPSRALAPDRPAWIAQAQLAAHNFPADPELWQVAGLLLRSVDPAAGRELERDAQALLPEPRALRAEFQVSAPTLSGRAANLDHIAAESWQNALDYSGWLMVQGKGREAATWLDSLPPEFAARPELLARRATLYAFLRQNDELAKSLVAGAWGKINADAISLALSSGLATQRDQPALAKDFWRVAQKTAGDDRGAHAILLRLAISFGWREQTLQGFDRLLALTGNDRTTVAQFAIWAHQQENTLLWTRALQLWRETDPPAAAAYLAGEADFAATKKSAP